MRNIEIESFIDKLKIYFKIDTDEELASKLDMTQPAITHWRRRGVPKKIIRRYQEKISGENEEIVVGTETIHIERGEGKVDANYIIELQKDKIEQQEKEIEILKSYLDNQPIEKLKWNDIDADMESIVLVRNVLSFKKMERRMTINDDRKKLEKLLDLPEGHNYFDDSKWYYMDEHPVDQIVDNKSLKGIQQITRTLPSLFESFKFIVGDHYMSFPVIYTYKDKRVITQCSIMLDWRSSPKKILTKTVFIKPEVN